MAGSSRKSCCRLRPMPPTLLTDTAAWEGRMSAANRAAPLFDSALIASLRFTIY
jgi:hypothetical protein